MGILKSIKKSAIKSAKGALGLPKNQKLSTTAKKAVKKALKGK